MALLSGCQSEGKRDTIHSQRKAIYHIQRTHFHNSMLSCSFTPIESPTVVIDVYTHNSTLTSGDSVPLGTQFILVCQVIGLPYGTPLSYTWTCPNKPCEVEGYYGRKVYNEHILAVNTSSTSDGETYICQVTATGGQEANGSFTLRVSSQSGTVQYYSRITHKINESVVTVSSLMKVTRVG